ncbi:DNA-processing protein DprA [Cellulomonas hominis]|uniref:DNA-processing protein DprA n=1 Tax=Cellulomonas hominis TaxID=156981 RepID=UPI001C113194|nr:DNA-processing protein DprA [Cellulomonas hominis]MBU5422751.1 DNA-processing protein DprA [Cellulomonas hominis]
MTGTAAGGGTPPAHPHDDPEVLSRVGWSLVAEPGDASAGAVVAALGAPVALAWAAWAVGAGTDAALRRLRALLRDESRRAGSPAAGPATEVPPGAWARVLARALPRWAPRLADLEPRRALDAVAAVGGTVLVPGRPGWPERLDDLGPLVPPVLWVRGDRAADVLLRHSVAVVGARAATPYGEHVARDLAAGLADRGVTVVSGGAFGIDVAAHRGAVLVGGLTVALLAGGVDRPSPAGNLDLLERLAVSGGALVAESPPGTPPTRSRFLQRNRLIAAVTGATVVVEAAWRSGALSTAARAGELLRPVGAVPGPVTSMASAGCHRLLRDGAAVCVTGVDDVTELLGGGWGPEPGRPHDGAVAGGGPDVLDLAGTAGGGDLVGAVGRAGPTDPPDPTGRTGRTGRTDSTGPPERTDPTDRADSPASRVLDALPARRPLGVPGLARRTGLAEEEVVAALGLLELAGRAGRGDGGWRRTSRPAARSAEVRGLAPSSRARG